MTTWKDSLMRRDEVKAAFEEGWRAFRDGSSETWPEAWTRSKARKRLELPLAD
jgi:hypothetical protein